MSFLIDGYNLLFALGFAGRHRGPHALEKSRADLLAWIERTHGISARFVIVVFDGQRLPVTRHQEDRASGIQVQFTQDQTADDAIEEIIRKAVAPRELAVISSDRRLQEAARRRGCMAWDCSVYIEWAMEDEHVPAKLFPKPAKPDSSSPEEIAHWLREFETIDQDKDLKKFNRPYRDFEKE